MPALFRDAAKISTYRGPQSAKATIDIYSCAGQLIRQIQWDNGVVKGIGWSVDERVLIVTEDGNVRNYTDLQDDFQPFSLGHGADDGPLHPCHHAQWEE